MTTNTTFEDRLLDQLRHVVADNPVPTTPGRRAPNRLVIAGAGIAAAATAAAVVTFVGGGTQSAYALDPQPDGSVTVHIKSLTDADGLQSSLRAAGIPAVVNYDASCAPATAPAPPPTQAGSEVRQETAGAGPSFATHGRVPGGGSADGTRVHAQVTSRVGGDGPDDVTFTLDPGQIDPGKKVFITTSTHTTSTFTANAIRIVIGSTAPATPC